MNNATHPAINPWYREPWPWLLMAGPAIVVVAGFVTLGMAIQSNDGLVADDYYKQGKTINRTIERDTRAQQLGYRAEVLLPAIAGSIKLTFTGNAPAAPQLRLGLHHSTRGGLDRELVLARGADGTYSAAMPALEQGRWKVVVDDSKRDWRLTGEWNMDDKPVVMGGR
jgi:uncharacterized protein